MSDITPIEVVTSEGMRQPIKPLGEWVNAQLDQFSKGTPNEQATEKIRSTCQFMRESASYFSELLRDGNIQPEQLSGFYSTYEGVLKARVKSLSGSEFISDLSQNCRPLTEALQPNKLKELNSAELIALCRVLQMGADSKTAPQKSLESAYILATTIQDKVVIKGGSSEGNVISTRKKEIEAKKDQEHVIYAPKVSVVPDTHGLSPDYYGVNSTSENVVSIGDIIDAPKNLKRENFDRDKQRDQIKGLQKIKGHRYTKFSDTDIESELDRLQSKVERNNKAAESIDIRRNVEVWSDLLENNRGKVVLGNHELMAMSGLTGSDSDLSQWLLDNNKGKTTLEAFGIDTSTIPPIAYDENSGVMTPLDPEICGKIRESINATPELKKFFDLLYSEGKMYVIANEALVVHAGVPLSADGNLIPPQRNGKNWDGFEQFVGLDALDKIEEGIRARDSNILHWLGNGSSREMTPGWVREPFFAVMGNDLSAQTAMSELALQARIRGADVKGIIIGHTESVGGKILGKYVLGSDTAVGDVIDLEVSNDAVQVKASHNFGSSTPPSYTLTNTV